MQIVTPEESIKDMDTYLNAGGITSFIKQD